MSPVSDTWPYPITFFFSWRNLLKFEGLLDFVHLLLSKNIAKMIYVEAEKKQRKSFIDKIEIKKVYCFFTVQWFRVILNFHKINVPDQSNIFQTFARQEYILTPNYIRLKECNGIKKMLIFSKFIGLEEPVLKDV